MAQGPLAGSPPSPPIITESLPSCHSVLHLCIPSPWLLGPLELIYSKTCLNVVIYVFSRTKFIFSRLWIAGALQSSGVETSQPPIFPLPHSDPLSPLAVLQPILPTPMTNLMPSVTDLLPPLGQTQPFTFQPPTSFSEPPRQPQLQLVGIQPPTAKPLAAVNDIFQSFANFSSLEVPVPPSLGTSF
jgi:hypothetical protein